MMFFSQSLVVLTSLLSLSTAHFVLSDPPARGFSENQQINFPCGGQSVSKSRTKVSLEDALISIALEMGHDQAAVQVLLGLGNDPGSNFNITLVPTFRQIGLGDFCLPRVRFDEELLGVPLEDGMNATLQVVTNGDPSGGLYNVSHSVFYFFWQLVLSMLTRCWIKSAPTSHSPPPQSSPFQIYAQTVPESVPYRSPTMPRSEMRTSPRLTDRLRMEMGVVVTARHRHQRT